MNAIATAISSVGHEYVQAQLSIAWWDNLLGIALVSGLILVMAAVFVAIVRS